MQEKIKCTICGADIEDKDCKPFAEEIFRVIDYKIPHTCLPNEMIMDDVSEKVKGNFHIALNKECEKKVLIAVKYIGKELDYSRNTVVLRDY